EDASAAVEVGLDLQALLAGNNATRGLQIQAGVHRGAALAATLNDHLGYFGTTGSPAMQLPPLARGGGLLLTQEVAADPPGVALCRSSGGREGICWGAVGGGQAGCFLRRVVRRFWTGGGRGSARGQAAGRGAPRG